MTKHTDSSRSTDSGVSGNAKTSESEIREYSYKHWTASEPLDYNAHNVKGFIEVAAPNDACFTALFPLRKDAEDYIEWKESGSECSRLASRVEELEKARKLNACEAVIEPSSMYDTIFLVCGNCQKETMYDAEKVKQVAEKALAGAHAEEKE